LFFKTADYNKAIEMYSECIAKGEEQKVNDELLVVVFSNRAMAYLKLREFLKAEADCSEALKLNDKHVKSLVRRGTARRRLERHRESLRDFEAAAEIEPENKEIKGEIELGKKKINTIKEEQKKKMLLPVSITEKPKTTIRVEDFDSEKPIGETEVPVKSDNTEKTVPSPFQQETTAKPVTPAVPGENTSEFLTLKDVEGHVLRHEDHLNEEEAQKQKVHFRLDLNSDDKGGKTQFQPVSLEKQPKKSALKSKRKAAVTEEPAAKAVVTKKTTDLLELKTSEAVQKGKELWHKQVIQEYEKASQVKEEKKNGQPAAQRVTTSSEFLNTWKHIKENHETCEKFLLGQARPERFEEIFREGIDFDYFMDLIRFGSQIVDTNKQLVVDLLEGMSKVKRFNINVKSMIGKEKKVVKEVVEKLKGAVNQEIVDQIVEKYKV